MTITVTRTDQGRVFQLGENTAEAARQAGIATVNAAAGEQTLTEIQAIAADLNFEAGQTRYLYGRELAFARVSVGYGLGDAIDIEGYHFAKYSIRPLGGLAFQQAADGFWEIDARDVSFERVAFAEGSTVGGSVDRFYDGKKVLHAFGADDGEVTRAGLMVLDDGTVVIPKLSADNSASRELEDVIYPERAITPLGDSLTAAGYADLVAANLGVPLTTASNVSNDGTTGTAGGGIGSQRSDQIAARFGAFGLICSVSGNQLVEGANTLTAIDVALLSRFGDQAGSVRTLRATIRAVAGQAVKGVLRCEQIAGGEISYGGTTYRYTFSPDDGEDLGAVAPGALLHVSHEGRADAVLLCWAGSNDVDTGAGWQDRVKNRVAQIIAAYRPVTEKIVLIGPINSKDRPAGSASYDEIVALNMELAEAYPEHFCDIRPAYNAGTADDTPAPAYSVDTIHYNSTGKQVIADVVTNFIRSKGWL